MFEDCINNTSSVSRLYNNYVNIFEQVLSRTGYSCDSCQHISYQLPSEVKLFIEYNHFTDSKVLRTLFRNVSAHDRNHIFQWRFSGLEATWLTWHLLAPKTEVLTHHKLWTMPGNICETVKYPRLKRANSCYENSAIWIVKMPCHSFILYCTHSDVIFCSDFYICC